MMIDIDRESEGGSNVNTSLKLTLFLYIFRCSHILVQDATDRLFETHSPGLQVIIL